MLERIFDLNHMFRLYCLLIGFALGHIQTGYIFGKTVKRIDIRDHGSHSSGMTNVHRVMGFKFALPTLLIDVAKSFFAFVLCAYIFGGTSWYTAFSFEHRATLDAVINNPWLPGIYGSLGAVLGHMFPVYMRFKGGKSVACCIGLALALSTDMAAILILIALFIIAVSRYISLASIWSLILLPVALTWFGFPIEVIGIGYFLAVLLIYKHKENIKRLLNGNENKLRQKPVPPELKEMAEFIDPTDLPEKPPE